MPIPKEYREICEMLLQATKDRRVNWFTQGSINAVFFQDFRLELWAGTDEAGNKFIAMGIRDPKSKNLADDWYVEEKEEEFDLMRNLYDSVRRQTGKVEQRIEELKDSLKAGKSVGISAQDLLIIESAKYGARGKFNEVTDILKRRIVLGRIDNFPVTNETLGGDPIPTVVKMLTINYKYMNQSFTFTYREGQVISLP
ncbi:MAG: hypothetical protein JXR49_09520 [Acidobacteria bacterium]|nr:hypothetical protein [Acidobacteriota bacterium]